MNGDAEPEATGKDRSAGLVVFGILLVLAGCVSALLGIATAAAPWLALPGMAEAATDTTSLLSAATCCAAIAVILVWLGIGSIMARRWARGLIVILGWLWLLTGVVTVPATALLLRSLIGGEVPPDVANLVTFLVIVALALALVAVPAAVIAFYQGRHVRSTFERRDPVVRWTDRCPTEILGLSISLALGALALVPLLVLYRPVVPFFGRLVTGPAAASLLGAVIATLAYCSWATYRLKPAGWWVLTAGFALATAAALPTFARVDLVAMYRAMGYPDEQLAVLRQTTIFTGRGPFWFLAITGALMFAYLFRAKRYFR